jgi:4-hydroxy-tetrahydrodipicolinate synthase
MFKGAIVAIVTPFHQGKVDEEAFSKLIEWQINEGIDGIVPCGTTGESSTLDYDEHIRVIEIAINTVNGRVPVIAGTGANSTDETVMLTYKAMKLKADAALLVTPYYNKPTQEGLYRHYHEVARQIDIPVILYNVPGRTSLNMLPATVARLAKANKNIVGIKEASGSMQQVSQIIGLCGNDFSVISGDDFTTLPLLALGGKGVISVVANIAPAKVAAMCKAWLTGQHEKAKQIHYDLDPLNHAMFIETNPIPVKTALHLMGKVQEEFRLPLCEMSPDNKKALQKILVEKGLLPV